MTRRKQIIGMTLGGLLLMSTFGCLKTPEVEYVTNKEDQGSLIADHAAEDAGIPIAEQLNIPERVKLVSEKTNEYTTLQFLADVKVPDATALPVYTMVRSEINEERMESWTKCLFDEEVYNYDYGSSEGYTSKEWLEEEIARVEDWLNRAEIVDTITDGTSGWWDDTEPIQMTQEEYEHYQQQLEECIQRWASISDTPGYDTTQELSYAMQPFTAKFTTGFDEITDEKLTLDYTYEVASFIGMKNEKQYVFSVAKDDISTHMAYGVHMTEELAPGCMSMEVQYKPLSQSGDNLTCKYTEEEAVAMCEAMLTDMGMTDMNATKIEAQCMYVDENRVEREIGDGYAIWFYRELGGASDDYIASDALLLLGEPEWLMLEYSFVNYDMEKQEFTRAGNREFAMFFVSDDGIIRAHWVNPMSVRECQAENVELLDFESVVNQGMIHLENQYTELGTENGKEKAITVTEIVLHYALMQSPYDENEYTLIPVWDFNVDSLTNTRTYTVVSINAIDGTVFDREAGY